MPYETLTYEKNEHVAIVGLLYSTGDQVRMARLSDELAELLTEMAWDREIRVILLVGVNEKSFSGGIDLAGGVLRGNEEDWTELRSFTKPIAKLNRPVIAAINGDAIGLGLELVLACDIRIAQETSRFGLPHIKTGLIPWDGGTQRLARLVWKSKALEMILTGDMIDAQEAYRIGLVNKVVSSEKLMSEVMDLAKEMASKGPITLRYAKEAINKGMDMTLEQGLRLEADLYCLLHSTRDRTEGIEAFREKRTPKFEGR